MLQAHRRPASSRRAHLGDLVHAEAVRRHNGAGLLDEQLPHGAGVVPLRRDGAQHGIDVVTVVDEPDLALQNMRCQGRGQGLVSGLGRR